MLLLRKGRWWFYAKLTMIRLFCFALALGYWLALFAQYGAIVASLTVAAAVGAVALATWIGERRKTARVRRILAAGSFEVNLKPSPGVTSAKIDAWLLLRGSPRGIAVDLSNRLLWFLFDERTIHALLPTAVDSAEIRGETDVFARQYQFLRLEARDELALRLRVIEGDARIFRRTVDQLLLVNRKREAAPV
jgi:hypothetical protein